MTDHVRRERLLVTSQDHLPPPPAWNFDWVARRLPGVIYRCVVAPELTMLALTERFEALTGYPVRALIGDAEHDYASLIHPDDRAAVLAAVHEVGERGVAAEFEYRLRRPDGRELWVRQTAWPVDDDVHWGDQRCIEGFIFDVSEHCQLRKTELERQLAHVRRQRFLIRLSTHDALAEGRFEDLSRLATEGVAELMQVERVSVWRIGAAGEHLHLVDLYVLSTASHELDATLATSQYPAYFEALRRGRSVDANDAIRDPRTREFTDDYLRPRGIGAMLDAGIRIAGKLVGVICLEHVGAGRQWLEDEIHFAGEVADQLSLTLVNRARIEAQAAHDELRAQLYHSQKMDALGRLAGAVAHDFNNALMAIGGHAELLAPTVDTPNARRSVQEILDTCERAGELVAQLLRFARREPLALRTIDLCEIVRRLEGLLRRLLDKRLQFEVRIARAPVFVHANESLIEQILTNLVINARDATDDDGQVFVDLDVVDSLEDAGVIVAPDSLPGAAESYARLRVIDDGMGMSPELRARVFEPFFTTKPPGKGTGLGLSTVYSIVRSCSGVVDIRSALGDGTTVTVLLPMVTGPASHSA